MENENTLTCQNCESTVNDDFEFCPSCGTLFIEGVYCINHSGAEAEGVCPICESAFCGECGSFSNNKFFCNAHDKYEVYQSMAKVYGSESALDIGYYKNILETEGLHPFVFSRTANAFSIADIDHSLFRRLDNVYKHKVNEIKLLVPFSEVLKSEEVIAQQE